MWPLLLIAMQTPPCQSYLVICLQDPRFIAVPESYVNNIPTDIRGLSFARTPQMNLNILMLGAKNGKGGFFPKGIQGRINNPVGFDELADGTEDWTGKAEATQVRLPAATCQRISPDLFITLIHGDRITQC